MTLLISTDREWAASVKSTLENTPEPLDVIAVESGRIRDRIDATRVDCVICPGRFVDDDGLARLEGITERAPSLPVICWGAPAVDLETALEAGVTDSVRTPLEGDRCRLVARRVRTYGQQYHDAAGNDERELDRNLDLLEKTEGLTDAGRWEFDLDRETVRWTDGTRRLIGVDDTRESTLENALQFSHPNDRPRLESAIETAITEGTQFDEQVRLITAEGETRYVRVRGDPHREDGRTTRVRGSIWDITERETQQQAARTSTAKLQALSTAFPDIAMVHDEDGRYLEIYAGASPESLLLDTPDDIVGKTVGDVVPSPQATRIQEAIERAIETGGVQTIEYQLDVPAGSRWFEGRIAPLEDRLDGKRAVVLVARDVTERKETAAELREHESHLTQAQSIANLGSWRLDVQAGELEWSDEVYRLFGASRAALPTVTLEQFYEFVHPDDLAFVERAWNGALEGRPYDIEHRIVVDGESKWVREKATLTFDEDGDPVSAIGVVQDITDRKEYERRLETQNEQLDVLNRIIRHDMRNQMNVIDGYASVLEERLETAEPLATEIRTVADDLLGMSEEIRTVNQLLIDADDRRRIAVAAIVDEAIESVRDDYTDFECERAVDDELSVRGSDALGIALEHVVENAIEHNDASTPRIDITAENRLDAEVVDIRIADNGPGIPDSEHELLTGERERSQLEHSSGLGLWIVNWIVSSVGGALTFENDEDGGTVVTIRLPSATDRASEDTDRLQPQR